MFGFQDLLVLRWEWESLCPKVTPLPQMLHFAMFDTPPSMGITKSTVVLYHILFRIAIGEKHFSVQKTGIFASFPGEIAGPGHLSKGRDEFLDPVERLRDVLHRVGVGDPGEAFAAVAERRAGDDRDAAFVEELLAEFLGGQPKREMFG